MLLLDPMVVSDVGGMPTATLDWIFGDAGARAQLTKGSDRHTLCQPGLGVAG